jgi:hypothetical protein
MSQVLSIYDNVGSAPCSDVNNNQVGCNDPTCAYGDCTFGDPSVLGDPGTIGLAGHSTENGGTAIASSGTSLTSIFQSLAQTAVQTSAALNAPKPTSGITLPGVGSVGTFGSSGMFLFTLVGLLLYFIFARKHTA